MIFGQPLSMYIIGVPPRSTTSGWPSWPRNVPLDCDQIICSLATLVVLMSFRRLWRVNYASPPGAAQRLGSLARSDTSSAIVALEMAVSAMAAQNIPTLLLNTGSIRCSPPNTHQVLCSASTVGVLAGIISLGLSTRRASPLLQ